MAACVSSAETLGQPCRQQVDSTTIYQRNQSRLLVPLKHGVAFPVPDDEPVIPDQGVDPLVTNAYAGQGPYETADLLRAPLLTQSVGNGVDVAGSRPSHSGRGSGIVGSG